jgi:zinc/manganese transport system substrate-binding protein
MRSGAALASAIVLLLLGLLPVAAQVEESDALPSIVVTTEVLGSVVSDLVGDAAEVRTLMDGGADPHSWQPSAREVEAAFSADLIVANGLDLEEGLIGVLEQAEADGVSVFHAADHIELRPADGDKDDHEADHGHGSGDPHFWLDPLAMRDVLMALGPALAQAGVDVGDDVATEVSELEALDDELRAQLAAIPDEGRQLVTGHGAMGYFADAYGFEIVGTVVPGLSSSDEPSARDIAELVGAIRQAGTTAVFSDIGTPQSVARAVADETGAVLIELDVARLPDTGAYADLLRGVADSVVSALAPNGGEQ